MSRVRGRKNRTDKRSGRKLVEVRAHQPAKQMRRGEERRTLARAEPQPEPRPGPQPEESQAPVPAASEERITPGGHDRSVHHERAPGVQQPAGTGGDVSSSHAPATTEDFLRAARGNAPSNIPLLTAQDPDSGIPGHTSRHAPVAARQAAPAEAAQVSDGRSARATRFATGTESGLPDAALATRPRARVTTSTTAARNLMPADRREEGAVVLAAMTPTVLPRLLTAGGRLVVLPPMKGTRDILVHQNMMADTEGLERIRNDADLDRMRAAHQLVPIVSTPTLEVNSDLPMNRRYARAWTAAFVGDISRAYYSRFGQALRLNSAVRTVEYQVRLQRVNGNAAATEGETASPHLTGQAIDFGKRGMSAQQVAWMRQYLTPLMASGQLDVEEEFQQACFHISVYRSYLPAVRLPVSELAVITPRDSRRLSSARGLTDAVAAMPAATPGLMTDPQPEK